MQMKFDELIMGMEEIISKAKEYDPNAETNNFGATLNDRLSGDVRGKRNKLRKECYDFILAQKAEAEEPQDSATSPKENSSDALIQSQEGVKSSIQFSVAASCNCCGTCCFTYPEYFYETDEGKAHAKEGAWKLPPNLVSEIEDSCPLHAITSKKTGKSNRQLLSEAVERLKNCKVPYPSPKDIPFKKEEYSISLPVASGEHNYVYSSDSAADRAARGEFDSKMYSQIDALILKIITEYRVRYIKPYYSKEESEHSVYAVCNKKAKEILEEISRMLKEEGVRKIPGDFSEVNYFPENDLWKMLNKGELISDEMIEPIRREFDSSSYTSLSSYDCYWDTDDMEMYGGTDWRGRTKYKDKYCYYNIRGAFQELAKDILSACGYQDDRIVERALSFVKPIIDVYNEELQKILASKIAFIEKETFVIELK